MYYLPIYRQIVGIAFLSKQGGMRLGKIFKETQTHFETYYLTSCHFICHQKQKFLLLNVISIGLSGRKCSTNQLTSHKVENTFPWINRFTVIVMKWGELAFYFGSILLKQMRLHTGEQYVIHPGSIGDYTTPLTQGSVCNPPREKMRLHLHEHR